MATRTLHTFAYTARRLAVLPSASFLARRFFSAASSHHPAVDKRKQHIVVALGGNALLKRGEPLSVSIQRKNIREGVSHLAPILNQHTATLVHGNGPQVGLLALMGAAYQKETGVEQMELDVLDAETEGMIGYLIEQELHPYIGEDRGMVTLLSQIVVDPNDPAFQNPTKFIGPVYTQEEASNAKGTFKKDGDYYRRVVPSPLPVKLIDQQWKAVKLLTASDAIVICAGGGGIPVVEDPITHQMEGVEAVIDKDRAATMLGISLKADGLLILTDVAGVATNFGTADEKWIKSVSPDRLMAIMDQFPAGSMGPKVESVIEFVTKTGGWSAIANLNEADKMMTGEAGTFVTNKHGPNHIEYYGEEHHSIPLAS